MDRISNQDLQDSSSNGDHTAIDTFGRSIGPENPVKNINRAATGTGVSGLGDEIIQSFPNRIDG